MRRKWLAMCHVWLLLFYSTVVVANQNIDPSLINQNVYKIEVIAFEHNEADRFAHEQWPQFVGELNLHKAIDWESLKVSVGALNSEVRALKNSKSERLIKHFAWEQAIASNTRSTPVYIITDEEQEIQSVFSIKPVKNIFNVKVDLIYNLHGKDKVSASEINAIRITRDIKIKNKELYYLDHPVIGLLILITPIDKSK